MKLLKRIIAIAGLGKPETFENKRLMEQRVAIATDVLQQVKNEKYLPMSGMYFGIKNRSTYEFAQSERTLQDFFKQEQLECFVCMVGSLFISAVRLYNNAEQRLVHFGGSEFINKGPFDFLTQWFTPREIQYLETCFEGSQTKLSFGDKSTEWLLTDDEFNNACEIHVLNNTYEETINSVMTGIIDNNGKLLM